MVIPSRTTQSFSFFFSVCVCACGCVKFFRSCSVRKIQYYFLCFIDYFLLISILIQRVQGATWKGQEPISHMGCEVRKHPGGSGADFGGGKQMFFSSRHVERCPLPQRLDLRGAPRGSKEKIDVDHLHVTIISFVVVFKLSFNE